MHAPPVRLLNLSNQDVKLYKGKHIGTFSPVEHIRMRCKDDVTNVHMVSTEPKSWKENLADSPSLNEDQRQELLNLLGDFESVFSQSPTNYGKTTDRAPNRCRCSTSYKASSKESSSCLV